MTRGPTTTVLLAASLGATAAALTACHPPHVRHGAGGWTSRPMTVAATLTCPPVVGRLTRTAQAADGQSCDYQGAGDEDVSLRRIALAGQPAAAGLPSIEAELRPLVPARQGPDPAAASGGDGDKARVDLPGIHVNAQGDQAEVHVFGITVHAKGENADVDLGQGAKGTSVQAGPNGAEVRVRDVDATNAQLVYVLAADQPGRAGGYVAVGYLARGPAAGPLVAAVFKARQGRQDWRGDRDINQLLRLNVSQ